MTDVVAVLSSDPTDLERVRRAGAGLEVINALDAAALAALMDVEPLLVVSQDRVGAALAADGPRMVAIGEPSAMPDHPRIAHVIRRQLPTELLAPLLRGLLSRAPVAHAAPPAPHDPAEARRVQQAFAASRRLAGASELLSTEQLAADAVLELVDADRAQCLFYDAEEGALWSEARLRGASGDERRAIAGLAGWAARTGLPARATAAGDDPRWSADHDDADPTAQLLVQPVIGGDGHVHAVLVAARRARRSEFGEIEANLLAHFAALAAPLLDQLSIHVQSQAIIDEAAESPTIFRREALEAQAAPTWGDVVRVSPGWISWAYWALVLLLAASAVFIAIGRVSTYSSGPAIVRSTARSTVTARTAGTVASVEHLPGDAVHSGDVVARLDDTDQRATIERLGREFESQLRTHLLDPASTSTEAALRAVRVELEQARTDLDQRVIRAKSDGVIGDVKVRLGQLVAPGDIVASIAGSVGALEVVALMPGADRPQLAPGMELRFELFGYRYAYRTLTIDTVSSDVLSPAEAKRMLGPEVADDLPLNGPVVVVKATLPTGDFEADGQTFQYHDGMAGSADVRVRSERIIYALLPGLRRL